MVLHTKCRALRYRLTKVALLRLLVIHRLELQVTIVNCYQHPVQSMVLEESLRIWGIATGRAGHGDQVDYEGV